MTDLVLSAPATRALLTMVRRRIRQLEKRAASPAQQAKATALLAAGRHDKNIWRLEQLRSLEDAICQSLAGQDYTKGSP